METTEDAHPDDAVPPPARSTRLARTAAPVLAALLVGGGAVFALVHGSGSSTASAGNRPARLGAGPGGAGGPGGGVAGEQHVQGTVTAKTSDSVTVRSAAGTATYTVGVTTEILRNGSSATLADVRVGEPVLVHVLPSSTGRKVVERLFAGTLRSGGPGPGPPGGATTGTPG